MHSDPKIIHFCYQRLITATSFTVARACCWQRWAFLRRADSVVSQVIVNSSKAVTLILGVYLLHEAANASASAGMCLSVVGAAMYALLP